MDILYKQYLGDTFWKHLVQTLNLALPFPAITPIEKMLRTVFDASLVFKPFFKGSAEPLLGKLQLCSCDQSLRILQSWTIVWQMLAVFPNKT